MHFLLEECRVKTAWLFLFLAGATEVTWAIAMKYSEGFAHIVCLLLIAGGIAGLKMLT